VRVLVGAIRYPPAPGGAETHAHRIARGLVERGHDVQVWTTDLYREHPFERLDGPYGTVDGVRVRRARAYMVSEATHYPVMPGQIGMLRHEADIVHCHSFGYFHTNVLALRRRLRPTPLVFTPHYHPPDTMQGGRVRHVLRRLYDAEVANWTFEQADRIIANSRAELDSMAHHVPDLDRVEVVHNGIDPEKFAELPEPGPFLDGRGLEGPVLLYVGRLAQNKRLEVVIDVMPELIRQVPGLTLLVVGPDDGAGAAWRERARELGVGSAVRFEGFLPERELLAAYTAADVFVLPSEWEAYGLVLLDAMACGTPCVVSDRGGPQEVVEDGRTGLVLPYGDRDAWRTALLGLLQDPGRAGGMGRAAREHTMAERTWSRTVDRVERIYQTVLEEAGLPRA
jgi:glycosyltransferase involved in cell wall biosynthesis